MLALYKVLQRADRLIAAAEAALLCLLLAVLAAGGLGLVLLQNYAIEELPGIKVSFQRTGLAIVAGGLLLYVLGASRRRGEELKEWGLRLAVFGALVALVWVSLFMGHTLDVVLRAIVLWLGAIGASLATRHRRHITIEALEKVLKPRAKRLAGGCVAAAAVLLLVLLCAVSIEYVRDSREHGSALFTLDEGAWEFRKWWAQLILPVALAVMAWRFLLILVECIGGRPYVEAAGLVPELEYEHDERTAEEEARR